MNQKYSYLYLWMMDVWLYFSCWLFTSLENAFLRLKFVKYNHLLTPLTITMRLILSFFSSKKQFESWKNAFRFGLSTIGREPNFLGIGKTWVKTWEKILSKDLKTLETGSLVTINHSFPKEAAPAPHWEPFSGRNRFQREMGGGGVKIVKGAVVA